MDVKQDGKTIPAVAIVSKSSLVFILDRVTGKPIYGVEERPVTQSDVPVEKTSPTQPFPVKPAPLTRAGLHDGRHRHGDTGARSRLPEVDRRQPHRSGRRTVRAAVVGTLRA